MEKELTKREKVIMIAYDKGYRINENGEIYSPTSGYIKGWIEKKTKRKTPYERRMFNIKIEGNTNHVAVSRLLAYQKFGNKIFETGIEVRHLDGNSLNNSYDNIEIGTAKDNANDKKPHVKRNAALNASSYNERKDWDKIDEDRNNGMSYKELVEKYGVSKSTLSYRYNKNKK